MTISDEIERGRELLATAGSVLVLTGAGISADSGVPTFRGAGGLWRNFRAEDLATPEAFARDPRLVWEWYGARREAVAACEPNAAHIALARWQSRHRNVRIATQNVDGLHDRASRRTAGAEDANAHPASDGFDRLLELHGTLFRARCTACAERVAHRIPIDASSTETLPTCAACNGLVRPDVVWFGETLDPMVIETAFAWASEADVCLVVGTSALVQPAASLATVTRDTGGRVIEVNPAVTPLTQFAEISIRGGAAAMIPSLLPA